MDNENVSTGSPEPLLPPDPSEPPPTATSTEDFAVVRHIVDAGILGASVVFLAAMLGVSKIDTDLTIAIVAFAIAMPTSTCGFIFTFPGMVFAEKRTIAAELIGYIAFIVGVFAMLKHLSTLAVIVAGVVYAILLFTIVLRVNGEKAE